MDIIGQKMPPVWPIGKGLYPTLLSARIKEICYCSDSEDEKVEIPRASVRSHTNIEYIGNNTTKPTTDQSTVRYTLYC